MKVATRNRADKARTDLVAHKQIAMAHVVAIVAALHPLKCNSDQVHCIVPVANRYEKSDRIAVAHNTEDKARVDTAVRSVPQQGHTVHSRTLYSRDMSAAVADKMVDNYLLTLVGNWAACRPHLMDNVDDGSLAVCQLNLMGIGVVLVDNS
jgi:hypothetical protein